MQRGGTLGPSESGTHGCVQPVHRTHARRSRYETAPIAARGGTPHPAARAPMPRASAPRYHNETISAL